MYFSVEAENIEYVGIEFIQIRHEKNSAVFVNCFPAQWEMLISYHKKRKPCYRIFHRWEFVVFFVIP